jgi:TonB family protein
MMTTLLLLSIFVAPPAARSPSALPQTSATSPVHVGDTIPPPQQLKRVNPVYPTEAQLDGVEGVVVIEATIGEDGAVRDAVVKRSIPKLDQAALDAVRQWRYTTTLLDGKPVAVIMTVTVNFTLRSPHDIASRPSPVLPGMIRLTTSRSPNGTTNTWEITSERAGSLPRRTPGTSAPSVSVSDAVQIAQRWTIDRYPEVQRFEPQNVALTRARRSADIDFWFYQIDLLGYGGPSPGSSLFRVVILPDGSIVESTVTAK